jgi:hypothetical protein
VEEQVGVGHFLERGVERLDELVRQAAHEADRVGQEHDLATREAQPPRGGIER